MLRVVTERLDGVRPITPASQLRLIALEPVAAGERRRFAITPPWGDRFRARARTATPDEKPAMWDEMLSHWKHYDEYQRNTEREIPVVVLERI